MRTPNEEQKKAIEHQGNVLLSAGAGSGKTFVLVEHVIYFVQKYLDETECTNEDLFLKELKEIGRASCRERV